MMFGMFARDDDIPNNFASTMPYGFQRPRLVTRHQAARYLGIGLTTLYHLTRDGKVKSLKIRGTRRYDVADLDSYGGCVCEDQTR